jgi:hypothetical protein
MRRRFLNRHYGIFDLLRFCTAEAVLEPPLWSALETIKAKGSDFSLIRHVLDLLAAYQGVQLNAPTAAKSRRTGILVCRARAFS